MLIMVFCFLKLQIVRKIEIQKIKVLWLKMKFVFAKRKQEMGYYLLVVFLGHTIVDRLNHRLPMQLIITSFVHYSS